MSLAVEAVQTLRVPKGDKLLRPLALVVSASVVDLSADVRGRNVPEPIASKPHGSKETTNDAAKFWNIVASLDPVPIIETPGGSGANIAIRLAKLREDGDGAIIMRSWTGTDLQGKTDPHGQLIRSDFENYRTWGLVPDIVDFNNGETPKGLVVHREDEDGPTRTITGYKSRQMPSAFVDTIDANNPEFAVVNSLAGDGWEKSLTEGVNRLQELNIPYIYTPGTMQFDALKKSAKTGPFNGGAYAVYQAIRGSYALSINKDELEILIKGTGQQPAENISGLLKQGKKLVPDGRLFITDGKKGAFGVDKDGSITWVAPTRPDKVVDPNGAGDAFTAGASYYTIKSGGKLREGLLGGSVSASYAVQEKGAHENPPTGEVIRLRTRDRRPPMLDIVGSISEIPIAERRNALPKQQKNHVLFDIRKK